jgi:hypothetical protein
MKSIKITALLTATLLLAGCISPTRTVYVPVEKVETGTTTVVETYPVYVVRPAPVYWSLNMGWYGGGYYYRRGPWHR